MMRVLVALSPRMYCEAMAHSVHSNRPGLDVRCVPPEDAERELAVFGPHLLVHNDTAPIPEGALAGVARRVEVLYSDSMSARVVFDRRTEEVVGDMDLGGLLAAVDAAEQEVAQGAGQA
jgi:hypothetical protein